MGLHERKYWRPDAIARFANDVGTMQVVIDAQSKKIKALLSEKKAQAIAYAELLKKYERLKREVRT